MINTIVRQTAFCLFERDVHDARQASELAAEDIGKIWIVCKKTVSDRSSVTATNIGISTLISRTSSTRRSTFVLTRSALFGKRVVLVFRTRRPALRRNILRC